jgi:hypothetical protein
MIISKTQITKLYKIQGLKIIIPSPHNLIEGLNYKFQNQNDYLTSQKD